MPEHKTSRVAPHIIGGYHGVFNKRGELLCVESSPDMAKDAAANLEQYPKFPTNFVEPVTVNVGVDGAIFEKIAQHVVEGIKHARANPIGEPFKGVSSDKSSPTDVG